MGLLQLYYFKALAENTTLTKTAEQLFITPPALSNSIRKLEEELGVQLFDRTGNSMKLNSYGKNYLVHVNEAITALENGKREIRDSLDSNESLSIGITISSYWFDLFATYRKRYPNIKVSRLYEPVDTLNPDMLLYKYDCILGSPDVFKSKKLNYYTLYDNAKPYLAVHKDNPLSKKESVSLFDLEDTLLLTSLLTDDGVYYSKAMQAIGYTPKNPYVCETVVRERSIQRNLGVAMVTSHIAFKGQMSGDIVYIPISDPCPTHKQAIITHSSRFCSKALKNFIDLAIDMYKNAW